MLAVRKMLGPLVVTLAAAGCASGSTIGAPAPEVSPEGSVSVVPTNRDGIECGQPFPAPAGGVLALVARVPATAPAAGGSVAVTVEVTSSQTVRGVATPRAEMFLVRDGRLVGLPVAQDALGVRWDLAPGQARAVPGDVPLVGCEAGQEPVDPGDYEVFARVVITPDDGPAVISFGGPWPLRVT